MVGWRNRVGNGGEEVRGVEAEGRGIGRGGGGGGGGVAGCRRGARHAL